MFTADLFVIATNLKQSRCLSMGEWLNQHHTYYSIIKKNKLLIFASICMNLQGLMLMQKPNLNTLRTV